MYSSSHSGNFLYICMYFFMNILKKYWEKQQFLFKNIIFLCCVSTLYIFWDTEIAFFIRRREQRYWKRCFGKNDMIFVCDKNVCVLIQWRSDDAHDSQLLCYICNFIMTFRQMTFYIILPCRWEKNHFKIKCEVREGYESEQIIIEIKKV